MFKFGESRYGSGLLIRRSIRARLRERSSGFAKDYLRAVVDEVRIEGNKAIISGGYERLIAAVANKKEDTDQVPSFVRDWRAIPDETVHWREVVLIR